MRRGANSFGHISADLIPDLLRGRDSFAVSLRIVLTRTLPSVGILLLSVILVSCSASSPRFRSVEHDTEEFRYAEKIRTEERLEDDRKVDLSSFRKNLSTDYSNVTPEGINRDAVLLDVVSYLGVPYQWGGAGKSGIDCSGFTSTIYDRSVKIPLPRTARDQYTVGSAVSMTDLQFGDLVFFNTTGGGPSHVGIYLEDDLFAHASVSFGVTISSLESTYYRKRFIGAKRVIH